MTFDEKRDSNALRTVSRGSACRRLTAATALICYFVRISPIWIFLAAAVLGLTGLI